MYSMFAGNVCICKIACYRKPCCMQYLFLLTLYNTASLSKPFQIQTHKRYIFSGVIYLDILKQGVPINMVIILGHPVFYSVNLHYRAHFPIFCLICFIIRNLAIVSWLSLFWPNLGKHDFSKFYVFYRSSLPPSPPRFSDIQ